jgi:hypothetical protein
LRNIVKIPGGIFQGMIKGENVKNRIHKEGRMEQTKRIG